MKLFHSKEIDFQKIALALKENFGVEIKDAGFLEVPVNGYNKRRGQYDAKYLLKFISDASIWVVDVDIYIEGMNFVFGLTIANRAIVSSYRIPQEIIAKEVVHEVGHLFGLNHCKNECVMRFSNSVADAITKQAFLCCDCKKKLGKR
ncbi:MAG: peptidase [Thermoplasmatales archaeon]|nr:peptidase [Thermoplasmatales archaeon]